MDLEKLGKEIDKLLESENEETLTNWLNERRVNAKTSEANLIIPDVSISLNMPDDWNGDATLEFKDGIITIEGNVRTEGGTDDEYFSNELTKKQVKNLYSVLKAYFISTLEWMP